MKHRIVCARCGTELVNGEDISNLQQVVAPCPTCMNKIEKTAVKASIEQIEALKEDIQGYRNAIEGHRMDGFKQGYKEGYKDGFKS